MLSVPVSIGEVIDKVTILEIKLTQITDPAKRGNIQFEHDALCQVLHASGVLTDEVLTLKASLKAINETLWTIEDDIRACERRHVFDDSFIQLARSVYHTNDQRAAVKRAINEITQSNMMEEKSYQAY
ncbi:hypothetical protein EBZ35_03650 [bacterium]|nr:hypothetical protein [bacterium]